MATDRVGASRAVRATQTDVEPGPVTIPANHPLLTGQSPAFRRRRSGKELDSAEDAAERLGVDPSFARTIQEYLRARRRLRLDQFGWRAALRRGE